MPNKLKVAVIFGGRSAEHDVSLQSAKNILTAIDRNKFEPLPVYVDRQGAWWVSRNDEALVNGDCPDIEKYPVLLSLNGKSGQLVSQLSKQSPIDLDVIFPVIHGPYGEDGSIQGLSKLVDLPCVGSGIAGSAIGMDKDLCKRLLKADEIDVADYIVLRKGQLDKKLIEKAAESLGYPIFVKPSNMGSSIGVSKAENLGQVFDSIEHAFQYDTKVLLEAAVSGQEIECAVLGNQAPIASIPGEIVPIEGFYSYQSKYINESGALLKIPAEIDDQLMARVKEIALRAFQVLECKGMARVDMFVTSTGQIFVNEVNTLPGFTQISMYPKLWKASDISYTDLVDRLIYFAIDEHRAQSCLKVDRS